jgi:hypothetical protein
MTTSEWIAIATICLGYATALIGIYVKSQIKLTTMDAAIQRLKSEMDIAIQHLKSDFHTHEKSNELTFTRLEESFKTFDCKLDNITSMLINMRKHDSNS